MKKTNKKFNSTCCDIQGALFLGIGGVFRSTSTGNVSGL